MRSRRSRRSLEPDSSLAWLDLDEDARQTMQEHLALLNQPDTMDQLGIGQVRDVFSSLFFPGTSTLWRRARYMLFVPWIYKELEENGTDGHAGEITSRRRQTRLIRALKAGEDENATGLIGARKDEPQRMPDELIWNGLRIWGIRQQDGSRSKYWRMLEGGNASAFAVTPEGFEDSMDGVTGSWWHARLPPAPKTYLEKTTFSLEHEEAVFLHGQLAEYAPRSLLAKMTQDPPLEAEGEFLWECGAAVKRLDAEMSVAVDHGRVFSYGMQGVGILYSFLVARERRTANANAMAKSLDDWSTKLRDEALTAEIRSWANRREAFWTLVKQHNPGLRLGTENFVDAWMAIASRRPADLLEDLEAERLITKREWDVKRNFARLSSKKALDHARDESGIGQLDYRWGQAGRIATDITEGLRGGTK